MPATRFTLHGSRERRLACDVIMSAPDLTRVEISEPKRSDPQNRALWAMIGDIMDQRPDWFGPGMDADDIKQVFMASLFKELRMARNADGDGYIPLTRRSSKLSWKEMSDLLTLIAAWGAREGVTFTTDTTSSPGARRGEQPRPAASRHSAEEAA